MNVFSRPLNEKQTEILRLLMIKPYKQNELQNHLGLTSPGLLYHLNKLEKAEFIIKKTIQQVGSAKINQISINPMQFQNIRYILGQKLEKCTLLTGFGELYDGYKIVDEGYQLLQNKHYLINRVVCITTRKGKEIREAKKKEENLLNVDEYYADYDYVDFRHTNSKFFNDLDQIIAKELKDAYLIIDITPLSKLYSFEMLRRANKYGLACYYKQQGENEEYSLLWMTNIHLTGEFGK